MPALVPHSPYIPAPLADRSIVYADREQWLAARRGVAGDPWIGATTPARILGLSPFGGPWSVWNERMHGAPEPDAAKRRLFARGHRLEPVALDMLGEALGVPAVHCRQPVIVRHERHPWAVASTDGFVQDVVWCGAEAKTAMDDEAWGESGTVIERYTGDAEDVVPVHYLIQAYWSLEVTGLDRWYVVTVFPDRHEFLAARWYAVLRDDAFQARLLEQVATWRERHLIRGEEPPVDGSTECARALARGPMDPAKRLRPATPDEAALLREYATLDQAIKQAEARKDALKNHLADAIGDAYGLTAGEGRALMVRVAGRRSLDREALLAARPDLAPVIEEYTRTGEPHFQLRLSKIAT